MATQRKRAPARRKAVKRAAPPRLSLPPRELVVMAAPPSGRRAARAGVAAAAAADVGALAQLLAAEGAALAPLFGVSEERLHRAAASLAAVSEAPVPDLSLYYRVEAPDERLDALAERLREHPAVQAAYVKPPAEPPQLNDMAPAAVEAPAATPDFTARQLYLEAAPGGIDAQYAWTRAGGGGAGVRILDVEGAWRFTHEDLLQNQGGVIGGTPPNDRGWRNHGTAVAGEFSGDRNGIGITGICPDANLRAISIFGGTGSAGAIRQAADALGPGDIILIELHRAGPRFNFEARADQLGYIAVEWWPDDFDAILYATSRGVIVVEAGGNGAEDLDDALYDAPAAGFPPTWSNPFRRGSRDSGAIVVGAGAPPPGTHGMDYGPDRSRLDFSNFGAVIDAQGWGREVTSTGYGDLQGGSNEDLWYTDRFSGTSSASPIVVGAVGSLQGALRGANRPPLAPAAMRDLLRSTGSPQQDALFRPQTQRIGNRPNLREMIERVVPALTKTVPLYRYWNPASGDHFYTTRIKELGTGRFGYQSEGIQCYVLPKRIAGSKPLHRYWNPDIADHFYTTNFSELGTGRYGYNYEGVQCYVYRSPQPDRVPLYRYWNPTVGDHYYTTDFAELRRGRSGYRYEGIQCYVCAQQVAVPETEDDAAAAATTAAPDEPEEIPETFRATSAMSLADDVPPSFRLEAPAAPAEMPATFAPESDLGGQEEIPETFRATGGGGPRQVTVWIKG